jgi:hypothetical protein
MARTRQDLPDLSHSGGARKAAGYHAPILGRGYRKAKISSKKLNNSETALFAV